MQGLEDCLLPTSVLGFKRGTDLTYDVLCSDKPVTMATCKRSRELLLNPGNKYIRGEQL